ncbi:helix-turn-helix transcriptional regulator [uncultured Prevotella sp.]|uniref:helix-turn-helix domain-containing protein n=1 Tax=uncultured Prevotella sp. TaxID=159272 RepID=UPI003459F163
MIYSLTLISKVNTYIIIVFTYLCICYIKAFTIMRIKDIIKEKGLTQVEVANNLGITRVGLNQLINGKPSYTTLEKLANILNVEMWELFISPTDLQNKRPTASNTDFTALVKSGQSYYSASTLEELKAIVTDLEKQEATDK